MDTNRKASKKIAALGCFIVASFSAHCFATCPTVTASPLGENIVSHGAIPNDGIDDSNAIYCAVEKAKSNSKKVIIPSGEFILSQTISMPNDLYNFIQFVGVGWSSIIQHTGGSEAFTVGDNAGANDPQSLVFRDFCIYGTTNTNATTAISFNRAHRSLVSHMRIGGYASSTVNGGEGAAAIRYQNTWVQTIENTAMLGTYNGVIAKSGSAAPVNALNILSSDLEIIRVGVLLGDVNNVNIKDNTIEGPGMQSAVICTVGCKSLNISGNYMEASGEVVSNGVLIGNSGYNSGISIEGNFVSLTNAESYFDIQNARGVRIVGNNMLVAPNTGKSYIKIGYANYVRYLQIDSNFTEGSDPGLWTSGVDYLHFIDPATGSIAPSNLNYGVVYDNQTRKLNYGKLTTFGQYP